VCVIIDIGLYGAAEPCIMGALQVFVMMMIMSARYSSWVVCRAGTCVCVWSQEFSESATLAEWSASAWR